VLYCALPPATSLIRAPIAFAVALGALELKLEPVILFGLSLIQISAGALRAVTTTSSGRRR